MPSLVLPSTGAKTINVEIFRFAGELSSRWDIVFSGVVCGIVPILIVFFCLQGYFVKGITAGAMKLLKGMEAVDADWSEQSPAIFRRCTGAYHGEQHRHRYMQYGDYFFIEAVSKLRGKELLFW